MKQNNAIIKENNLSDQNQQGPKTEIGGYVSAKVCSNELEAMHSY